MKSYKIIVVNQILGINIFDKKENCLYKSDFEFIDISGYQIDKQL